MEESEFDKFADEYTACHAANLRMTGEGPEYFAEYKIRDVRRLLTELELTENPLILDFGAGIGSSVRFWQKYIPEAAITCLDVSKRSIEVGRARNGDAATFVRFDGVTIPFAAEHFDVAFAACVFHHIDHDKHQGVIHELKRVLKRRGLLVVYEHNPYNPLTLHAVNNCPFDENAHLVRPRHLRLRMQEAGFDEPLVRYRVFFPRILGALRVLEDKLTWLPLGAQYYVAAQNS